MGKLPIYGEDLQPGQAQSESFYLQKYPQKVLRHIPFYPPSIETKGEFSKVLTIGFDYNLEDITPVWVESKALRLILPTVPGVQKKKNSCPLLRLTISMEYASEFLLVIRGRVKVLSFGTKIPSSESLVYPDMWTMLFEQPKIREKCSDTLGLWFRVPWRVGYVLGSKTAEYRPQFCLWLVRGFPQRSE